MFASSSRSLVTAAAANTTTTILVRLQKGSWLRSSLSFPKTFVAGLASSTITQEKVAARQHVNGSTSSLAEQQNQKEQVEELIREVNESQSKMNVSVIPRTTVTAAMFKKPTSTTTATSSASCLVVVEDLVERIRANAWKKIEKMPSGASRIFCLDSLPTVSLETYRENTAHTAEWLHETIVQRDSNIILYIGFEAFYDLSFDSIGTWLTSSSTEEQILNVPLIFSPLVKSTREYIQNREMYDAMESKEVTADFWSKRTIVHLGASHAMDRILFQEDSNGYLQAAWNDGRLIILSPELAVVDEFVYRSNLSQVLASVQSKLSVDKEEAIMTSKNKLLDTVLHRNHQNYEVSRVQQCDYKQLDKDILAAKQRVASAQTMEEAFAEVYRFVSTYTGRGQLDCPCYFDSGWESFHLYKSVSKMLGKEGLKIPWTRLALINARNAAIGDSLHAFYATTPEAFPLAVCGDTAGLLAGGISMINIHAHNRFGAVVVLNNRGMAIEDVISKRSVDGHQYQYEYVKLDRKRDIFTLAQLKDVIQNDVLSGLRDYLWGVAAHRTNAIVLNIDVQSLRRENADKSETDAILMGRSFLDDDFGERVALLEEPRKKLEAIVDVLYDELNSSTASSSNGIKNGNGHLPVKIVGCSAIEYMEIVSQLTMISREKLQFLPSPTDLLATRTLLPSLVESPKRVVSSTGGTSNFVNSNNSFSVFISNAAFGPDGLNNLISTHLEYGTGTMVHLAYDAAEFITHYSLIGQIHRNFGIRPSTILPSMYRNHQAYEGQILLARSKDEDLPNLIRSGLRNPEVKVILIDMGAPNLTASLT